MCAGKDVFFRFVRAVKDIMPNNVKTLTLDDNVGKALQFMKQSGIRHVCVVDVPINKEKKPYFVGVVSERDIFRHVPIVDEEGAMVGILSDRDVLRYLPFMGGQRLPGTGEFRSSLFHVDMRDPSLSLPISSIMTRNVTHIRPDCSFYDAVKMLRELKISCLPVIDEEKKLRGIVTVSDVMRALLSAYELAEKSGA
jgi:CBS domain-containing protein